jgi:hypothetical protein
MRGRRLFSNCLAVDIFRRLNPFAPYRYAKTDVALKRVLGRGVVENNQSAALADLAVIFTAM